MITSFLLLHLTQIQNIHNIFEVPFYIQTHHTHMKKYYVNLITNNDIYFYSLFLAFIFWLALKAHSFCAYCVLFFDDVIKICLLYVVCQGYVCVCMDVYTGVKSIILRCLIRLWREFKGCWSNLSSSFRQNNIKYSVLQTSLVIVWLDYVC